MLAQPAEEQKASGHYIRYKREVMRSYGPRERPSLLIAHWRPATLRASCI